MLLYFLSNKCSIGKHYKLFFKNMKKYFQVYCTVYKYLNI